jgi:ABC-type sugar transport system ATPase subunit
MSSGRADIEAVVELIEPLGQKKIVNLKLEDSLIKTFVPSDYQCEIGQKLGLALNKDRMHIFEKSTGATIV